MKKLVVTTTGVIAAIILYIAWPRHFPEVPPMTTAPQAANPSIAAALAAARVSTRDLPPSTPPDVEQPADLPAPGLPGWVELLPGQRYERPNP